MNQIEKLSEPATDMLSAGVETDIAEPLIGLDLNLRYGYRLGDLGFLLPEAVSLEVVANPNIFSIPNTVEWMKGLISVRGSFATVFDMGTMLDLNLTSRQVAIIVLQLKGDYIGFPVDSSHSLELPSTISKDIPDLPEAVQPFAGDSYKTDLGYWFEFDFSSCISQYASQIHQ